MTATITKQIARRIIARWKGVITDSSNWSLNGAWFSEVSIPLRVDDGSTWARLGHGPVRKRITLQWSDRNDTAKMWIVKNKV